MKNVSLLLCVSLLLISCKTNTTTCFMCNEEDVLMYVDDECIGSGMVYYPFIPKGTKRIEVTARKNGIEVYRRVLNAKQIKGKLIEIGIPNDLKYSSNGNVKPKYY